MKRKPLTPVEAGGTASKLTMESGTTTTSPSSVELSTLEDCLLSDVQSNGCPVTYDGPQPCTIQWRVRLGAHVRAGQPIALCTPPDAGGQSIRASCSGVLRRRFFESGQVIGMPTSGEADVDRGAVRLGFIEPQVCPHTIVVGGLCTDCAVYVPEVRPQASSICGEKPSAGDRAAPTLYTAALGFVTSQTSIAVKSERAQQLEIAKLNSLIRFRKLPLILDLDNTLLHCCTMPPPSDAHLVGGPDVDQWLELDNPQLYISKDDCQVPRPVPSAVRRAQRRQRSPDDFSCSAPGGLEQRRRIQSNSDTAGRFDLPTDVDSRSPTVDAIGNGAAAAGQRSNGIEEFTNTSSSDCSSTNTGSSSPCCCPSNDDTELYPPHYDESPAALAAISLWESRVIAVSNFLPDSGALINDQRLDQHNLRPYSCFFKLRPGVIRFLQRIAQLYELYLFTAGTAIHAFAGLHILDPERRWFGNRVFAREDLPRSFDGVPGLKTIQRIFPGEGTRHLLVTVVDDSERMWPTGANVLKVQGYHWWHELDLHPLFVLAARRNGGRSSDGDDYNVFFTPAASENFSRMRCGSTALLNYCPSIVAFCRLSGSMPGRVPSVLAGSAIATENLDYTTPSSSASRREDSKDSSSKVLDSGVSSDRVEDCDSTAAAPDTSSMCRGEYPTPRGGVRLRPAPQHQQSGSASSISNPVVYAHTAAVAAAIAAELIGSFAGVAREDLPEYSAVLATAILRRPTASSEQPSWRSSSTSSSSKGNTSRRNVSTPDCDDGRAFLADTRNWRCPKVLRDNDRQLEFVAVVLEALHREFYAQVDLAPLDFTKDWRLLPNVKVILDRLRRRVLNGVSLQATGIRSPMIPDFGATDLGRAVYSLGAELLATYASTRTNEGTKRPPLASHLLVARDTAFFNDAQHKRLFDHTVHLMWYEAALYTFQRFDEKRFEPRYCERHFRNFWDAIADVPAASLEPLTPESLEGSTMANHGGFNPPLAFDSYRAGEAQ